MHNQQAHDVADLLRRIGIDARVKCGYELWSVVIYGEEGREILRIGSAKIVPEAKATEITHT